MVRLPTLKLESWRKCPEGAVLWLLCCGINATILSLIYCRPCAAGLFMQVLSMASCTVLAVQPLTGVTVFSLVALWCLQQTGQLFHISAVNLPSPLSLCDMILLKSMCHCCFFVSCFTTVKLIIMINVSVLFCIASDFSDAGSGCFWFL